MRHQRLLAVVLSLVLVVVAACGDDDEDGEDATGSSGARTPVVIDTDMSIEGAMAIMYLLEHPDVDVLAVGVSGTGLVRCPLGARQAAGVAELVGATEVPVACGPEEPLEGSHRFPLDWRVTAEERPLPEADPSSDRPAPDVLASAVLSSDEPVVVVADGPLTDVALLLEDPEVVANVARVVTMLGAVDVAGNVSESPDAEWNAFVDPVAAERVLRSGVPVTMVPLDATVHVPLTSLHAGLLEPYADRPAAGLAHRLLTDTTFEFQYLWDQLNAAVALGEPVATLEDRTLTVVTDPGAPDAGATRETTSGSTVLVAVDADREEFERAYFSVLVGEPVDPVDLTPDVTATFDGAWDATVPDAAPLGPLVVSVDNRSPQLAVLVVGRLTGDATLADLDAWDSIAQPPFLDLDGVVMAEPGASMLGVVEPTTAGEHVIAGLAVAPDSVERLAVIDVG